MYFKVAKNTATGQKLTELFNNRQKSIDQFKAIAKQLSDLENPGRLYHPSFFSGYLFAIEFKNHPGREWAEIKGQFYGRRYFYPSFYARKNNTKKYQLFISANDPVYTDVFTHLFGLEQGCVPNAGMRWFRSPGCAETPHFFLVEIQDLWALHYAASRPSDLIEITATEYHNLLSENEASI